MNIQDYSGDSLLHYAAGSMDEDAICRIISAGANIMSRNNTCEYNDQELGFEEGCDREENKEQRQLFTQQSSLLEGGRDIARIPLQVALKNGNGRETNEDNNLLSMA